LAWNARRAEETRSRKRPGTALDLRSVRGGRMDGLDCRSSSPRIGLASSGAGEGFCRALPDVGRTETAPTSCRARLRARRKRFSFSRHPGTPPSCGRLSVLSGKLGRDSGPRPSSEGRGLGTAPRICPAAFLPTGVQVPLPARAPRSRRDLDVTHQARTPKALSAYGRSGPSPCKSCSWERLDPGPLRSGT